LSTNMPSFQTVYPLCNSLLVNDLSLLDPLSLPEYLDANPAVSGDYPFLSDLARIERQCYLLKIKSILIPGSVERRMVNPALELLPVQWHGLVEFCADRQLAPMRKNGHVLVYRKSGTDDVSVIEASGHDLLALKLVFEGTNSREAAAEAGVSIGTIDDILDGAVQRGLLLAPKSKIIREPGFPKGQLVDADYFSSPTFTLQWHITQDCDLHCRHCYDRSNRETLDLDKAVRVLDDLYNFAQEMHVFIQVTFTGGNPLLYPSFNQLYQEAADRGFMTAILGNPMPRHRIDELTAIQKPEFYQVSLEGLQEHNDYIRGLGHFVRTFEFLNVLKELEIYSMVMLTLTRANKDDVLELAELLRGRVDLFTFNRLAMVGEGAALASVDPAEYPVFLEQYMEACEANSCMSLKDNFFNLLRHRKTMPYVGGCAGYGCGAAFNFVSLLPDGQVDACRKLPSPIGNIKEQSFTEIYHGELARQYRAGSSACNGCEIRPVCGGCLAVSYGFGRDIFTQLDPYCFR